MPYTVLACESDGDVIDTENPVAETTVTAGLLAATAEVVDAMTTIGTAGSVVPNVTATSTPVADDVPVPAVRLPLVIVEPAATTGDGGAEPAPAPAAAVTVVESHGE